jgi:hypothetical protein
MDASSLWPDKKIDWAKLEQERLEVAAEYDTKREAALKGPDIAELSHEEFPREPPEGTCFEGLEDYKAFVDMYSGVRLSIRLNEDERKQMLQLGLENPTAYRAWQIAAFS